ncbi:hypothetical protein HG530_009210 [Fusarium avenaceum]|nr:hypothetical protein HG530_009210 [Fusarium avenaceum]
MYTDDGPLRGGVTVVLLRVVVLSLGTGLGLRGIARLVVRLLLRRKLSSGLIVSRSTGRNLGRGAALGKDEKVVITAGNASRSNLVKLADRRRCVGGKAKDKALAPSLSLAGVLALIGSLDAGGGERLDVVVGSTGRSSVADLITSC